MPPPLRAAAIAIHDQDVALILRDGHEGGAYYEIPGGGVEEGESLTEACLRELWEETGLRGVIERPLAVVRRGEQAQHYFLVRVEERAFSTAHGPEHTDPEYLGRLAGRFEPRWVPAAALGSIPVWPAKLAALVNEWFAAGIWPDEPVHLEDHATVAARELP